MKSVSALILICAFACASAQFGVKGGASGNSNGVRSNTFFPRLNPGSIQEKKEQLQLATVDEVVGGPSVVGGGVGSGSNGFVQPAVQPENVVQTFVQERPTQSVLVPASGSVSSLPGSVSVPVSTSVGPQSQVVQSVSPVQSIFSFVPSFEPVLPAPAVGSVPVQVSQVAQPVQTVQTVQPAVQSFQSFPASFASFPKTLPQKQIFFDNRQPQQFIQFGAGPSFPNFAQNIVHFSPQPQVATVQTVPSFATVGKVGKQFVAPAVVSQPAPLPVFSSVPAVPGVQTVSSTGLPVPTNNVGVAPVSGQIFTDNKISSSFGTVGAVQQQVPSPVISQEKQLAETVQTTEW